MSRSFGPGRQRARHRHPSTPPKMSAPSYLGNCHCGRYRFSITVPDIVDAKLCACGVCKKKGSIWLHPPAGSFEVVRDDGTLTEYQSASLRDKVRCPNLVWWEPLR